MKHWNKKYENDDQPKEKHTKTMKDRNETHCQKRETIMNNI